MVLLALALCLAYLDNEQDRDLFEQIYLAHRKQMFILAVSILHNDEDAEDTVSDVFLRIAQKNWDVVSGIQNKSDLRNYLLKAVRNTALNKLKKSKKSISTPCHDINVMLKAEDVSDEYFFNLVCTKIEYDQIVKAIRSLDSLYKDVFFYHFVLGLTVRQTADALNQTVAATNKQLVRGKKILLSILMSKGA